MLKKSLTIILVILGLLLLLTACSQQGEKVYIKRVIDGDTVETAAGDSIRLLGVDTPEIDWENNSFEFYAEEAREFTAENLLKENVELEYDREKEDSYGRTLAYILQDGEIFNQKLLEEGYASVMIVEPNNKYESNFKKAAAAAREAQIGVWSQVQKAEKELPVIGYQQAEIYLNQRVVVEGRIVNTAATDSINYLNFSDNYQDSLSLIIFNQSLNKFDYQPAEYIKNRKIKVLGKIELYQGSPQIVVEDPYDILIID